MTMNPGGQGPPSNGVPRRFGTTRVEAFSDGVFAVAVNLPGSAGRGGCGTSSCRQGRRR